MNSHPEIFEFGEFLLDPSEKRLTRSGGEVVQLPPKAFDLLVFLVVNHGQLLSKRQILGAVWAHSVVEEGNLKITVHLLRRVLGEGLIETVPRRGYRFVTSVRAVSETHAAEKAARPRRVAKAAVLIGFSVVSVVLSSLLILSLGPPKETVEYRPKYSLPSVSARSKVLLVVPFVESHTNDGRVGEEIALGLIARIGRLDYFNVRPTANFISPEVYSGLHIEPASEKADFVVDGVVEKNTDGSLTIDARLFDVQRASVVWQGKPTGQGFVELVDEIAGAITKSMLDSLDESERSAVLARRPTSLAAYSSYRTGIERFRRRRYSTVFFEDAVRLDPEFAAAHAMLAVVGRLSPANESSRTTGADAFLSRAFALNPRSADAFAARGFLQMSQELDWEGSERSLRSALEMDPFNIEAHHWLARLLAFERRFDESKAEMALALESDPTSASLLTDYAEIHFCAHDFIRARAINNLALAVEPDHEVAVANSKKFDPKISFFRDDQREEALREVEKRAGEPEMNILRVGMINVDPRYDFIRSEPRFQAVLKRLKLVKYR